MNTKIFITGPKNIDKLSLAKKLVERDDDLSIAPHFTNDLQYKDVADDNYLYYLSTQDIDLTYKNNFVLFVNTDKYVSSGITMDIFYNNEIFCMSMCEFNNISESIFNNESNDILIIWLDTKDTKSNDNLNEDICEAGYLMNRLDESNLKYLYFIDENDNIIINTIFDYLEGNDEERKEILNDNN